MTGAGSRFQWHQTARVFVAGARVGCAQVHDTGFQRIDATPTELALGNLLAALRAQASFCVAPANIPDLPTAAQGDFLTLTGGSSGVPKVIRRSQASWIASFAQNAALFDLTPRDRVASLGALSHSLSLYAVLEALHLGLDVNVLDALRPRAQRAALAANDVTILYATPSQLHALTMGTGQQRLPALRLILCGGGALSEETRTATETLCPNADLRVFYGAAETSFITLADAQTPPGSVGRPYPGVELRLKDGEVWVRSPYLFSGYALGASADTRLQDGFLTVGEMGWQDTQGNLWLQGRRSRMVTVADQNVFPEEIESVLTQALAGRRCAVIPVPDTARGHRLTLVLEGPSCSETSEKARALCRERFCPVLTPQHIYFSDRFPELPSGKVDLQSLTEQLDTKA